MRAKYGDIEVCPKCNGTGYRVFRAGAATYSVPCFYTGYETRGQLTLIVLTPARRKEQPEEKKRRRGNRWHTKN